MISQQMNILEFIAHPQLLNDQTLSGAQRTFLKVTYGSLLDSEEREIYQRATGRTEYVPTEQKEATLIGGRRGGKDSKVAARIVIYEAFRDHHLARGDRGYVMLIAPTKRQAQIAMRYIRADLRSSSVLRKYIAQERHDEIELTNGITIACYPCSYIAVRGLSIVCAICDELAFWRHEETAANPEEEVIKALRPAMLTFPKSKLIKISTPYRKEGILWREFQQRGELDYLVWQIPSHEMNPTLRLRDLEQERNRDEEHFRREYLAQFTDQINAWITPDVLEASIVRGRTELPHVEKATYVVAIDPAFKHDDFALAILHRNADETIIVDRVARWAGTKKAPLPFEWVCQEIARIVKQYGINTIVGDQYCAPIIKQYFYKLGIHYDEQIFGGHTREEIFGNLKHLLVQRKIELLDDPTLLKQLRVLEERKAANGSVDIEPSHGQKDDVAIALALAAFELSNWPSRRELLVEFIPAAPRCRSSLEQPRPQSALEIPLPQSSFGRSRSRERGWIVISG